jgi:hypothetical protein
MGDLIVKKLIVDHTSKKTYTLMSLIDLVRDLQPKEIVQAKFPKPKSWLADV